MAERNYYVFGDDGCKFPGMTYEQIIAAIAEATGATPTNIEDAFISKIKELNGNNALQLWAGTEAEYNALDPAPAVTKTALRFGADNKIYLVKGADETTALAAELEAHKNNDAIHLTRESIYKPENLAPNETETIDLDTLFTAGRYYIPSKSGTKTGMPTGVVNGWLDVMPSYYYTTGVEIMRYCKQVFYRHGTAGSNDYQVYTRLWNRSGWGAWNLVSKTS